MNLLTTERDELMVAEGEGSGEGIVGELEWTCTYCYIQNGQSTRIHCIAHGTLLNVMWQPGWEGSLGENGYMYMYG